MFLYWNNFQKNALEILFKKWQGINEQKDSYFPGRCRSWHRLFGSKLTVPSKAERCVSHDPEISRQDPRKRTSTQGIMHKTGVLEPSWAFKWCKQLIRNGSTEDEGPPRGKGELTRSTWSTWVSIKYVVEGGNCTSINCINIQNPKSIIGVITQDRDI